MKIEEIRIDEISNHEKNPKQHPDKQIRLLEESIKRFGWTNPVILSADNTILAGHARVKAAIAAGNDTVPCIRTKLTGQEADAYLLADNRLSDIAPYDRDILAELLSDLPKDLAELTGFDSVQVEALLSGEDIPDIEKFISDSQPEEPREEVDAEPQIDRAAELNKIWKVKTGDLWQLGDHRLICGDCTDAAVIMRLMQGEKADLMVTDPPYGVEYDPSWRNEAAEKGLISYADRSIGVVENDGRRDWTKAYQNISAPVVYVWHAGRYAKTIQENLEDCGYSIIYQIIWAKPTFAISRGDYHWQHEPCWYAVKKGTTHNWQGSRSESTLWKIERGCKEKTGHGTEKPIECMKKPIENNSSIGQIIADPFLGSGTTLIACENTGRKCRGIEISPDYVAVCLQRYQDATGKEPVRINV